MKFLITRLVGGFMRDFGCSIKKITPVLIRPGSMVRIHHGPLFYFSNPHLVYHDLKASSRRVQTVRRWR
jgi:hypothetical protein